MPRGRPGRLDPAIILDTVMSFADELKQVTGPDQTIPPRSNLIWLRICDCLNRANPDLPSLYLPVHIALFVGKNQSKFVLIFI